MKIESLEKHPEYLWEVSNLIWKEWEEKEGYTLEEIIYRTKHCCTVYPMTLIALQGKMLVGTISIWNNDLKSRQDLFPWLACLYVKKEFRHQKIGTKLQNEALRICKSLDYKSAYLITDHENLYEKNGWKFLEYAPLGHGIMTKIYQYDLKEF